MSSCVAELDGILTSMLELKPPGVSAAKISAITSLCNANIQSESPLIQKVYAHFKKAPANKKLGVLYVVDSVTRQWFEQARKAGQVLGSDASGATFAAGVKHVTDLLPALMQDIIAVAPEDQKVKIKKLIDIWERGNTFPAQMLNKFKDWLNAPASNAVQSTTPNGTPPRGFASPMETAKPAQDTLSILNSLRAMAANGTPANATVPLGNPTQGSSSNVSFPQTAFQQNVPSVIPPVSTMQPGVQAVNAPTPVNNGVFSYPGGGLPQNLFPNGQASQPAPMPVMPQNNVPAVPDMLQQQLQILAALRAQGIPQEQWPGLLSALMASAGASTAVNQIQPMINGGAGTGGGRDDQSRDRNGFDQYMRSPPGRYRGRSRSRSPGWERRRESPQPRRRDSPVYGEYGGNRNGDADYNRRGGATRGSDRGNGKANPYRQRSPDRFRRSASPRRTDHVLPAPGPKWIDYDPTLPKGHIKVYSRTLFVGGVTTSEDDLRSIFVSFGRVQTCIVNVDKRHAFVKMITRDEAVRAKEGMEHFKHTEMQLRTRWGVGFGPRDCSDYQTGISVIPVERLTDADRKWMLTAEYGGTGGKSIEEGMAVEEPDIEIGAGVSSKAISRRMQTDKSGTQGPRSTREPPSSSSSNNNRYRQPDRRDNEREAQNPVAVPPTVPSFGFQFPMMANGLQFQLPPGFVIPGQSPAQPPPPGAT